MSCFDVEANETYKLCAHRNHPLVWELSSIFDPFFVNMERLLTSKTKRLVVVYPLDRYYVRLTPYNQQRVTGVVSLSLELTA